MNAIQAIDVIVFSSIATMVGVCGLLVKPSGQRDTSQATDRLLRVRRDVQGRGETGGSLLSRFDRSLESILIRGGVPWKSTTCVLLVGCVGLLAAGIANAFHLHVVLQFGSFAAAMMLGLLVFYVRMKLRLRKFAQVFPMALDSLQRAVRAGTSLEDAFRLAAESSSEPVRGELTQCVRQLQVGLSPPIVIDDLANRIGSTDVHLFSHTIDIHQRLGGRLSDSIDRLSSVVRERSQTEEKVKSMTSIGRNSVIAIVLMGIFVLGYMLAAQPEYIDNLYSSALGIKLLIYAAVSELVGLIWVGMVLRADL